MNWIRRAATLCVVALANSVATTAAAGAAGWQDAGGDCHNGGVSGATSYLWCWDKKERVNDNTPNYDVFAFYMSLSGEVTNGFDKLNRLWVEMDPRSTSPAMSWYSTDPRKPNQSYTTPTGCKDWSWSIGVSQPITAAYSESGTICSSKVVYEPVNSSEYGHHGGQFWNSACWDNGVTKRVTAAVIVKVAQNKVPLWETDRHGMTARRASPCTSY